MVRIQDSQSWHRGSIPLSTTLKLFKTHTLFWWIHLMVRIQDSQSWHRGSIPLSTTPPFVSGSRDVGLTERLPFFCKHRRDRDTLCLSIFIKMTSIFKELDYGLSSESDGHIQHIATGSIGYAHCSIEMKPSGINLAEFHI